MTQIAEYIDFLQKQFKTGNTVRDYFLGMVKALAPEQAELARSPAIKQLIDAVVKAKPVIPAIPPQIWDAEVVLDYFRSLPPNDNLPALQLAGKCIVLLMLASGRRKGDLMGLDVSPLHMRKTEHSYFFALNKVAKGNDNGSNNFMQYVEFHRFPADNKICPHKVITDYLRICQEKRGMSIPAHSKFWVATSSDKPVHRETVRRWAMNTLCDAGIDVNRAKPHSIRSAHSSMAVDRGESIDSVMERCGWTKTSTFLKHYLRPIMKSQKPTAIDKPTSDTTPLFCPPRTLSTDTMALPADEPLVLMSSLVQDAITQQQQDQPGNSNSVPTQQQIVINKPKTKNSASATVVKPLSPTKELQLNEALMSGRNIPDTASDDEWTAPDPTDSTIVILEDQDDVEVVTDQQRDTVLVHSVPIQQAELPVPPANIQTDSPPSDAHGQTLPTSNPVLQSVTKKKPMKNTPAPPVTSGLIMNSPVLPATTITVTGAGASLRLSPAQRASLNLRSRSVVRRSNSWFHRQRGKRIKKSGPVTDASTFRAPNDLIRSTQDDTETNLSMPYPIVVTDASVLRRAARKPDPPPSNVITIDDDDPTLQTVELDGDVELEDPNTDPFQAAELMESGHCSLETFFPDLKVDRLVLFGKNMNYSYPMQEGFDINALIAHFVCIRYSPLELGVILPMDYPDPAMECIAITVNDMRFKTRVLHHKFLRDSLIRIFGIKK